MEDDRPDDRPDDREDDTDRAIRMARAHVIDAVNMLVSIMYDSKDDDARARAATALLEMAGCL